jgi:uncharacterized protein YbaR (Trm112 family)
VRASNTEPLLRLNVEARDRATMERVRDRALAVIRADTRGEPVSDEVPSPEPVAAASSEPSYSTSGSTSGSAPGLERWLRDILRCPSCRGELRDATGPTGGPELVCVNPECGLAYRVDDGIPVMLVDEARRPDQHPDRSADPAAKA